MQNNILIGIASDHAGYELKDIVKKHLQGKGFEVKDFGTNSAESVDYPDFAHPLADYVESASNILGVSICGSGNGISMTLNKHQGVRAALCWNAEIAALAIQHNNANVCSLPARFVSNEQAIEIIEAFLSSEFEGGRHISRVNKIPVK